VYTKYRIETDRYDIYDKTSQEPSKKKQEREFQNLKVKCIKNKSTKRTNKSKSGKK